jgi:hypothetical protein
VLGRRKITASKGAARLRRIKTISPFSLFGKGVGIGRGVCVGARYSSTFPGVNEKGAGEGFVQEESMNEISSNQKTTFLYIIICTSGY